MNPLISLSVILLAVATAATNDGIAFAVTYALEAARIDYGPSVPVSAVLWNKLQITNVPDQRLQPYENMLRNLEEGQRGIIQCIIDRGKEIDSKNAMIAVYRRNLGQSWSISIVGLPGLLPDCDPRVELARELLRDALSEYPNVISGDSIDESIRQYFVNTVIQTKIDRMEPAICQTIRNSWMTHAFLRDSEIYGTSDFYEIMSHYKDVSETIKRYVDTANDRDNLHINLEYSKEQNRFDS